MQRVVVLACEVMHHLFCWRYLQSAICSMLNTEVKLIKQTHEKYTSKGQTLAWNSIPEYHLTKKTPVSPF